MFSVRKMDGYQPCICMHKCDYSICSFKRRRLLAHHLPFFIHRQVSHLIQRVVRIWVVVRVAQCTPVGKEHVHDRRQFAHGVHIAGHIPFFHANEVLFKRFHIRVMPVHGFARNPRTDIPPRVSERAPRIRAVRFAGFVAAGAMHPNWASVSMRARAFGFQAKPPNGRQSFVKSLTNIGGTLGAKPVAFFEIFRHFAVYVVARGLYFTAQVALERMNEAHVKGWRQNARLIPINFVLVVHPRVNRSKRQIMITQSMLCYQFGRVAQMQRRVLVLVLGGGFISLVCSVRHI